MQIRINRRAHRLLGKRSHGQQLIFERSKLLLKVDARQDSPPLRKIIKKIVHHACDSLKNIRPFPARNHALPRQSRRSAWRVAS
jgi:hypothetical protein